MKKIKELAALFIRQEFPGKANRGLRSALYRAMENGGSLPLTCRNAGVTNKAIINHFADLQADLNLHHS